MRWLSFRILRLLLGISQANTGTAARKATVRIQLTYSIQLIRPITIRLSRIRMVRLFDAAVVTPPT